MSLNPTGAGPDELPDALDLELAELARPYDEAIARLGEKLEGALPAQLRDGLDELEALHYRRTAALVSRAYTCGHVQGRRDAREISPDPDVDS